MNEIFIKTIPLPDLIQSSPIILASTQNLPKNCWIPVMPVCKRIRPQICWGVKGLDRMGILLMQVRDELEEEING